MSASPPSTADHVERTQPAPSKTQQFQQQQQKRKASQAGLDNHGTGRSVKRRASKACQCCRARKVRCNVTEHGAPCTNCRLDEVECIVSESRRKKKWTKDDDANPAAAPVDITAANVGKRKLASRDALDGLSTLNCHRQSHDDALNLDEHVPHSIYATHGQRLNYSFSELDRRMSTASSSTTYGPFGYSTSGIGSNGSQQPFFANIAPKQQGPAGLPLYIKPLPPRIGPDEIAYLEKKGALTIPHPELRTELLRAYVEFVHPFMPLLDLHDFLIAADASDGSNGKISLILFQAVMFAGSAFADMSFLRKAGYSNRKEARKDFFQKTRLLYDFDYEQDRVSLVQALLLLTYYYETPDDQKDTWHWMGVATSVAHTIGLHRNPNKANMDPKRVRLWKRIWWSTYMRDRLIALGMRRPTRIKDEDYDVPMMTLDDFHFEPIPEHVTCIPSTCVVARDVSKQRQLAQLCIQKAKLCLCISHVLSKQYCVLNNNLGLMNDRTTMMLLPKKLDSQKSDVQACDQELQRWLDELPDEAKYEEEPSGNRSIDLHMALLHMVFYTTLSALHRPQVLPSAPTPISGADDPETVEMLDSSRRHVRRAAVAITCIAQKLDSLDLVRYLPTTGVTVLLPAIIIHLLDIKAQDEETRRCSLRGFCQCMLVMGKLRDLYAAADYSTAFLEAAIRKAGITIAPNARSKAEVAASASVDDLVAVSRQLDGTANPNSLSTPYNTITPPPDNFAEHIHPSSTIGNASADGTSDEEVARRLETFLASTPPASDHHASDASQPDVDAVTLANGTGESPAMTVSGIDMNPLTSTASDSHSAPTTSNDPSSSLFPWSNISLESAAADEGYCFSNLFDTTSSSTNPVTTATAGPAHGAAMAEEGVTADFDALMNMDAMGDVCNSFSFNDFGTGDDATKGEESIGGLGLNFGGLAEVDWLKG
ncbi:fungal-specific transcription factor domain-containing protein [Phyllosticta paracitricarpa]